VADAIAEFGKYLAAITDPSERARAISKAKLLGVQEAPPEAFKAPIKPLGEFLDTPVEVPPCLISAGSDENGKRVMLVRGGIHVTIGRAGKGKTVMNLNRILRWSAGLPMFPGWETPNGEPYMAPEQPLRILVVENEGAGAMFHRQIGIMLNSSEHLAKDARELARDNVLIWGEGGYSDMKLDDAKKLNALRAGVEEWKPDIVFIEPFRSLWTGDENSSTDMTIVIDALTNIAADFNCGVLFAHHMRKSGFEGGEGYDRMSDARGSGVLEGAVTFMENFDTVKGGEQREVSWSKSRYTTAPNPVRMEWDNDHWWYSWVPISALDDSILTAIRSTSEEAMSIADLQEVLEEPKAKLRERCKSLVEEGRLASLGSISTGHGSTGVRYRIPIDENSAYSGLAI